MSTNFDYQNVRRETACGVSSPATLVKSQRTPPGLIKYPSFEGYLLAGNLGNKDPSETGTSVSYSKF